VAIKNGISMDTRHRTRTKKTNGKLELSAIRIKPRKQKTRMNAGG
jgi:hypothetical protein